MAAYKSTISTAPLLDVNSLMSMHCNVQHESSVHESQQAKIDLQFCTKAWFIKALFTLHSCTCVQTFVSGRTHWLPLFLPHSAVSQALQFMLMLLNSLLCPLCQCRVQARLWRWQL